MAIGHIVRARQIGRRGRSLGRLVLAGLRALQVIEFVAAGIEHNTARRSQDHRATIAAVHLYSIAARILPGDQLVAVIETCRKRIVKLPIVLELIAATHRCNVLRQVDP